MRRLARRFSGSPRQAIASPCRSPMARRPKAKSRRNAGC